MDDDREASTLKTEITTRIMAGPMVTIESSLEDRTAALLEELVVAEAVAKVLLEELAVAEAVAKVLLEELAVAEEPVVTMDPVGTDEEGTIEMSRIEERR